MSQNKNEFTEIVDDKFVGRVQLTARFDPQISQVELVQEELFRNLGEILVPSFPAKSLYPGLDRGV